MINSSPSSDENKKGRIRLSRNTNIAAGCRVKSSDLPMTRQSSSKFGRSGSHKKRSWRTFVFGTSEASFSFPRANGRYTRYFMYADRISFSFMRPTIDPRAALHPIKPIHLKELFPPLTIFSPFFSDFRIIRKLLSIHFLIGIGGDSDL